jgi:hypothetical protein
MSRKPSLEILSDLDQHLHPHVDQLALRSCSTEWHLRPKISRPILEGKSLPEWMKLDLHNFDPHSRLPPPLLRLVIPGTESKLSLVSHHVNQSRPRPRPKLANQGRAEYPLKPRLLTHYHNQPRPSHLERKGHPQQRLNRIGGNQHLLPVNPLLLGQQPSPSSLKHPNDFHSQVEVVLGNQSLQRN